MFGGGAVTPWTRDQLRGLARQKVLEAIRDGHGEYAKTMTRELLRLTLAAPVLPAPDRPQTAERCRRCGKPRAGHTRGPRGLECYVGEELCWLPPTAAPDRPQTKNEDRIKPVPSTEGPPWWCVPVPEDKP